LLTLSLCGRVLTLCLAFIAANPPEALQTDISLSQYLAIQEKGVSAWEFEPELEIANCFVEARTEIEFFDSECTVLSNLPVPKQNDVYYWEAKVFEKPESTLISIGMATKPYPLFRLPGKALRPARAGRSDTNKQQASTSTRLHICRMALAATINRLTRAPTALRWFKATLLAWGTDRGRAPCSLHETARSWRTSSTV
jgi:hypothetical protein